MRPGGVGGQALGVPQTPAPRGDGCSGAGRQQRHQATGGRRPAQEEAVQEEDQRRQRRFRRQQQCALPCRTSSSGFWLMLQPFRLGAEGQELHQALQLVGKLKILGQLNTVAPGLLVYINEQLSGRRFLVYTGAAFSILPHHSSDPATGQGLVGPSGSPIRCWGESAVTLKLAGQHFTWSFLLADVSTAILATSSQPRR
jgi:hypothetical protein